MPGITISPTLSDITLTPGVSRIVEIQVTNNDPISRILDLSIADAIRATANSGVELIAPGPGDYHLSPITHIVGTTKRAIDAGQTQTIAVQLDAPDVMPNTGLYGALVVAVRDNLGSESVAVQTSISALIFARSNTLQDSQIVLDSFDSSGSVFELPQDIVMKVSNPGSVHTAPRGRVLLITPDNDIFAQGYVNESSSIVLPGSERTFTTKLTVLPNVKRSLIGKYQLVSEYRSNGAPEPELRTQSLWYIDPRLAIAAVLVVAISGLGIFVLWKRFYWR